MSSGSQTTIIPGSELAGARAGAGIPHGRGPLHRPLVALGPEPPGLSDDR
jgi:hypothetical protein